MLHVFVVESGAKCLYIKLHVLECRMSVLKFIHTSFLLKLFLWDYSYWLPCQFAKTRQ